MKHIILSERPHFVTIVIKKEEKYIKIQCRSLYTAMLVSLSDNHTVFLPCFSNLKLQSDYSEYNMEKWKFHLKHIKFNACVWYGCMHERLSCTMYHIH